jgi:hypothetical protein
VDAAGNQYAVRRSVVVAGTGGGGEKVKEVLEIVAT